MRKQNLLSKKIRKQISNINNLLENYFNSLRRFILDARKLRFDKNNRVFLIIVSIIFLTLIYFLIPTAYDKKLIEKEIKNQIYQKYNLVIKFDNVIQYNFFPKPHFSSKNLSILNDQKKIGEVEIFKIFIDFQNFLNFNQIKTQDIIFDKADLNIKKSDLNFFTNLLKTQPSRNKIKIKRSNIFFTNKNDEVLFINQINHIEFYYDFKNLKNILVSKGKIFNVPYKLIIENDQLNEILNFEIVSKKLVLKIENKTDYKKKDNTGSLKLSFKNKNNIFNYEINENTINIFLNDTNKSFKVLLEFKPFYLVSNLNYQTFRIRDLFNNPFFMEILKSQILNNKNLNALINFDVKNVYDFNRFSDLSLKLKIEDGNYNFSNSNITWKENVKVFFSDVFLNFDKGKINLNGRTSFDVKDKDEFFKFFQIKKELRKNIEKIDLDFNYDLNEEKISFDNLRIDNKSNKKIEGIISSFNSSNKRFLNKITFKNFVNDILIAYFG
tara:strand:- start:309 stop:1796 length:1488 start_codon:yes stop_codon:yes gene_type:complete